ncbi:MAG TPA: transglutaminase domain-containing protein [Burkholderiales bacterium]|nr:transglutaminase domain-containing protein [Burkholderiales bacterium]
MDRRTFLKRGAALPTAVSIAGLPRFAFANAGGDSWRVFEITTAVEVLKPAGATRIWLPVPLTSDTEYQKSLGNVWTAEGGAVRYTQDARYRAGIVAAEFPQSVQKPTLRLVSRFATRDRAVDLSRANGAKEDPAVLRLNLAATELLPTDGIVRRTAHDITRGKKSDLDKARAIYEWVVDNTFRDPQTRGCGVGDIKSMLEAKNLGGKCADLNALFVGLARSIGIPARDVYGVRVAASKHGYKSLGASSEVITKAQHCRAEFYAQGRGWVPVDPADVRKVVLEEPPGNLSISDEKVQRMRQMLFGAWEMNWLAYNYAHDVALPGAKGPKVPFFMYPNGETAAGRLDSLDPDSFKYTITSRELKSA